MPRILLIAILLLFSAWRTAHAADWQTPPAIMSKALQEEKSYRVLLPDNYATNPQQHYPVMYLLDGQSLQEHTAGTARFLARVGQMPELIIVSIDSSNRLRDFTPTDSDNWVGDGGAKHFLAFMADELIPDVERRYRSDSLRIIAGHSASGLFAVHTMYAQPALFDAVIALDGSLDWEHDWPEQQLRKYFSEHGSMKKFLYFNSSYQTSDDNPFTSMANMLEKHAPKDLRWSYQPMPEETHSSIPLQGMINGLKQLYRGWQVPEPIMMQGMAAVDAHYASIRDQVGAPKAVPESVFIELGYFELQRGNTDEAIRVFMLGVERYPTSDNAFDSLSDAYLEAGRLQDALTATSTSIELAKKNGSHNLDYYLEKQADIEQRMAQ